MRRILITAIGTTLAIGLSGCTSGGSSAEPYGGQCDQISGPLAETSMAMVVPGAANFSDMDLLQEKVWDAGFESIGTWMGQVESAHSSLELLDTSAMSADEAKNIEYLQLALSNLEINKAVVIGDSNWYTETYETLMVVGGACG
jgi:hypothetical protein